MAVNRNRSVILLRQRVRNAQDLHLCSYIVHRLITLSDRNGLVGWIVEEKIKIANSKRRVPQKPALQRKFWALHGAYYAYSSKSLHGVH